MPTLPATFPLPLSGAGLARVLPVGALGARVRDAWPVAVRVPCALGPRHLARSIPRASVPGETLPVLLNVSVAASVIAPAPQAHALASQGSRAVLI